MPYEHYQLTEYQYNAIVDTANGPSPIIMAVYSKEGDDPETVTRLNNKLRELEDMVQLGFLKDGTGKMVEITNSMELQTGRKITVFTITDTGYDMFHDFGTKRLLA